MPYQPPSPQSQSQPQPPRPPPPPPLHTTSSQQASLLQWLGQQPQSGAKASTIAPPAGLLQASAQLQNGANHNRTPPAFASTPTYGVQGRVATSIPPPVPSYNGQTVTKSAFSPPVANGHTSFKTQAPQIPRAQHASQTPLIPPIPQLAQTRPGQIHQVPQIPQVSQIRRPHPPQTPSQSQSQTQARSPQHSPIPPPSIPPRNENGNTAGAVPRAPNARSPPVPAKAPIRTSTTAVLTAGTQPPSRPVTIPSFSAMEVDELANTDYEDDDPVPLIISDLDPRFGKPTTVKSPESSIATTAAPAATPLSKPPGTPSSLRQPVVSIPSFSPSHKHSLSHRSPSQSQYSTTPSKSHTTTVSVSIPSFSPRGSASKNLGDLPTVRPPMPQTKSPGGIVGRRTKSVAAYPVPGSSSSAPSASNAATVAASGAQPQVQIKGGRPKGWKPGMSYREVALRNMGIDTNDPTLPTEFLLPLRDRRGQGKIGRPRLHPKEKSETSKRIGRPPLRKTTKDVKEKKGRVMYGKRIGRPPLQTVEEIQRDIFRESSVQFVPFKCEWAGCRAELQNLATLRRHVEFVHGRGGVAKDKKRKRTKIENVDPASKSAPLTCLWRKCATREPPVQFSLGPGSQKLNTFMEHMEYYHLEPLSWHQGDGFANTSHLGPPPKPASIVLAEKEADLHRLYRQTGQRGELEDAAEQYAICATTAAPDMAIQVPTKYVPGYLIDKDRQVTPVLRDPFLEMSSAFMSADEWGRRIKDAYRQQNKRPERGWTG